MGNPYYVNPDNTGLQWANFGMGVADTLMRRKLAMEDQALRQKTLDENIRMHNVTNYGTDRPTPGMPTLQAQQLGINRQQADTASAQVPHHKRNFGTVTAKMGQNTLTKLGVKKENPLFTTLEEMANNPAIDNEQAYLRVKNDYPTYYQTLKNEIADDYVKKFEKDENYANTPEGKKQLQILDALDKDQTGDTVLGGFFPATVQSMDMEQRKLRAAQTPVAVVGKDGRLVYMSAEEAMRTGAQKYEKEERAYKVGHVERFSEGRNIVAKIVTGYDNQGLPVWKEIARGEKDSPDFDKAIRAQEIALLKQVYINADNELSNPIYQQPDSDDPNDIITLSKKAALKRREDAAASLRSMNVLLPGETKGGKKGGGSKPMSSMPSAAQNKGRTVRDTKTGKRYTSNGTSWVEVK